MAFCRHRIHAWSLRNRELGDITGCRIRRFRLKVDLDVLCEELFCVGDVYDWDNQSQAFKRTYPYPGIERYLVAS